MDIDGSGAIDDADEAVEDLIGNGHFGKILIVNNNDDDHDGIPDYADGFSIQGGSSNSDPDYRNANEQFAKLQIKLSGPVDLDEPCFRFSYTQIHPQDVIYRTDSGYPKYEFPQISGGLRIWRKPGQEARSPSDLLHDGDFVAAGTVYTARQLGFTQECGGSIDLWVEAVQRSPQYYPFVITFTRVGGFSDHIRVTTVEFGFARVQGDAILAPKQTVEVSQPSPEFSQTSIHVGNLHRSADGKKLLADVAFTGSLTDKASNLIPGQAGIIDCLAVNLNGLPLLNSQGAAHVVNVGYTKSDSHGTMLQPHLFNGWFTQLLQAVEVQPGVNHIQLVATNAYGYSGYAEVDFDVAVVVPQSRLIYSILEFVAADGANPDRIVLTLSTTDRGNERSVFELSRLPGTETYVSAPATPERNGYLISIVDEEPEGNLIVSMTEWNTRGITFDDYRYVCTRGQNPGTDFYEGQLLITDVDYSTWNAHGISIENLSVVSASTGGTFKPQLIEILAAPELISRIEEATIGTSIHMESCHVVEKGGRSFLAKIGVEEPLAQLVIRTYEVAIELPPEYEAYVNGAWSFSTGFGAGFYSVGVDMVDGVEAIARGAWHLNQHYEPVTLGLRILNGQGVLILEDQRKVQAFMETMEALQPIVEQLVHGGPEIVEAILLGDHEAMNNMSDENRVILEFIAEIIEEIGQEIDNIGPYQAGVICGVIAGEVAVMATTTGAGTVISKGVAMANVVSRVQVMSGVPNGVSSRLAALLSRYNQLITASPQGGRIRDLALSLYLHKRKSASSSRQALFDWLDETNTPSGRKLEPSSYYVFDQSFQEIYAEALQTSPPDLTKVPKVSELKPKLAGRVFSADLHDHHTVPMYLARMLIPGISDAELDEMPGIVLHLVEHLDLGEGSNGLHKILNRTLPPKRLTDPPYEPADILRELEQAYIDFERPDVWLVAREWLRLRGSE